MEVVMNTDYLKLAKILKANDTPTLDSNESTRVSVYITEQTVATLFNIINFNENLSIKKIFDHSSKVITDQITSESFLSFMQKNESNDLLYTTSFTYIFLKELQKNKNFTKKRKTFVMSKRTEKFFRIISDYFSVSIDSCIDSVISTYRIFTKLNNLNLCKTTRLFLQEIFELYYILESLSGHPFVVNIAPFVSPSSSDTVHEMLFDQIGSLEKSLISLTGRAFKNNSKEIIELEDKTEEVSEGVLVKEFNLKSSYELDKYEFIENEVDNEEN